VFETDDASHLMSVTRSWGMLRIWEVDDAEDRHVGTVYAKSLVSSDGERLAWIEPGRLLDPAGQQLASFSKRTRAWRSDIRVAAESIPAMLVLGCALALDPGPHR